MREVCAKVYALTSDGGAIYFMQREKNTEFVLQCLRDAGWTFQNLIIWKKKTSAVPGAKRFGKHYQNLAIKLNRRDMQFTGGELIELKDSEKSYSVASFNSTIPTGEKDIKKLTAGQENTIREQMQDVGNNIRSLPIRQVFYLIRGRKQSNVKVCLTHGKFFETIPVSTLISESFGQALEERLNELEESLSPSIKQKLLDLFSEQQTFSFNGKFLVFQANLPS